MFQYTMAAPESSFKKLGFSNKVWRCLERATGRGIVLSKAPAEHIMAIVAKARETLTLCSDDRITSILAKNASVARIVNPDQGGGQQALLALLPLNTQGFAALCEGRFSGLAPEPDWICPEEAIPDALYVWLVYMPGSFARTLGAVSAVIDDLASKPCPLFSRAVNRHSARLHSEAGFMSANMFYPSCDNGLQVVFPQATPPVTRRRIEVKIARTIEEVFQVFSVRSATYIAEQFCLYGEEFDGNDFCATQFLGTIDGDAAGCLRVRFFNGFAKLERFAVRKEYRNSRLVHRLMHEALEYCRRKGYSKVYGHSRIDLVRFWRFFGFKPIADREPFAFANVRYAEMLAELEPHPSPIQLDTDPMVMIRPEGAWDRPGPFDMSLSAIDPRRKQLLEAATRTVGRQAIAA